MKMKRLIAMAAVAAAVGWAQTPAPAQPGQLAPPPARPGFPAGRAPFGPPGLMYANIELTVYLVSGLAQPQAGAAAGELPDDLAATLNQMRGVFAYKTYKLINAFTLRGRNGSSAEVAGEMPLNNWAYDFKYNNANLSESTPGVVHINHLRLEITKRGIVPRAAAGKETANPLIYGTNPVALVSTDLDIKEGQKTVVGQSAVNGTDALFLVIVPKVIEQ
jgi:hypothetical protein